MIRFIHYDIPQCEQLNLPEGRRYRTPNGDIYPSVTTVLGAIPNSHLDEWRRAVGKETAKKIGDDAARRGTKIHSWAENYLKGVTNTFTPYEREERDMFTNMIPHLDQFEEIHALETRLWSDKLKVAGTVDCVARIAGTLYIVDFKTSRRYKTRDEIDSYFMQTAAYAVAFYERTKKVVTRSRVIISTQDDGVLIYDTDIKDWVDMFIEVRCKFN